jgi:sulfate permease, SulP family
MPRRSLTRLYKDEFSTYSFAKFQQRPAYAGLTVAQLRFRWRSPSESPLAQLPLQGLVTAILAGFIMGALTGAPYQMTGAPAVISVVLIVLVQSIWSRRHVGGALHGRLAVLLIGLPAPRPLHRLHPRACHQRLHLGHLRSSSSSVRFDNFLGIKTPAVETAAGKFLGYFNGEFSPDIQSLLLGLTVMGQCSSCPKNGMRNFPPPCSALILATLLSTLGWSAPVIGSIPQTLLLQDRLSLANIPWDNLSDFIAPVLTITALGAVESLLLAAQSART